MKRVLTATALVGSVAFGLVGGDAIARPAKPGELTVAAAPNPVVFGKAITVSGRVTGAGAGVKVQLEQDPFPFAAFAQLAEAATDASGNYTFANVKPIVNTRYRVEADVKPKIESAPVTVFVRPATTMHASDYTPAKGQRVRFYGTVAPAHDGRKIAIQRRGSDRVFRTVANVTLTARTILSSRYSIRLRISRSGVYRARFAAHDDHTTGFSRNRTLTVH